MTDDEAPTIDAQRILVVGHGVAGRGVADDALAKGHNVVGFLDDELSSPDVLGRLSDVNQVVHDNHVDTIYFAIPTIEAGRLREFIAGLESDLRLSMLPRTYKTISTEAVGIGDLTDVDILQLVGRRPVKHDLLEAEALVSGRRALVTGAAGSIGSRLTEHLLQLGAESVTAFDWWENGLFHLANRLGDSRLRIVVGDVKNRRRVERVFADHRPDLVFHAAAYKHVPINEDNPTEALANNALGAEIVLTQAIAVGASHAVYVSTDKAVRPANVMGASKRLGELLLRDLAGTSGETKLTAVRFGNVLQSNGSVMETFRRQIEAGGPLTVTHRDVTRYFMTIDEAAQLIIQSTHLGENGDICVLDMGDPVRIMELAESLVKATAPHVKIEVTQLRPGEKLYEELTYNPDLATSTDNSKVFIIKAEDELDVPVTKIREVVTAARDGALDDDGARRALITMGFAIAPPKTELP
ncbi:polysaccharide biosynthesis protein [Microbacterium sp. CFH 31415]|uniref:polysaccharide biosynthesis protein n=1 Tax=Microbacterium sp. CFH 31415 TaxID=2921732 RepID=UPI001F1312AF|nr:polysaccharide biosynthesis protein [Microbacterium sp. CFH 31415]MCH6231718.1 polysaccharide biosynthesis protein [Microbacterium sp. CFH 31415]